MLHERISADDSYIPANVAAVWPAGVQIAPLPITDIAEAPAARDYQPTPSAPDVPGGVGVLIVAAYVSLIASLALAAVASRESAFMIVIAALFLVAFFTVPRIFLRVEPKAGRRPSLDRFMHDGMETLTGHSTGGAALVQMLIVPVSLTFGILAIAVAAAIYM
jgi:hypothetical protein